MGKIVAIGGGEIGRPGYTIETEQIDKELIRFSGKKKPKFLFLPTASGDSAGYCTVVENYFGKRLGCIVTHLLLSKSPTPAKIRQAILGTDIIYVGGGNTLKMLQIWRKHGVDKLLRVAYARNIILAGVSAGAICWFQYGLSDSRKNSTELTRIRGLGFIRGTCCPHYDVEKDRKPHLSKLLSQRGGIAFALENCTAIKIVDGQYCILKSKPTAQAYTLQHNGKQVSTTELNTSTLKPLVGLYR